MRSSIREYHFLPCVKPRVSPEVLLERHFWSSPIHSNAIYNVRAYRRE